MIATCTKALAQYSCVWMDSLDLPQEGGTYRRSFADTQSLLEATMSIRKVSAIVVGLQPIAAPVVAQGTATKDNARTYQGGTEDRQTSSRPRRLSHPPVFEFPIMARRTTWSARIGTRQGALSRSSRSCVALKELDCPGDESIDQLWDADKIVVCNFPNTRPALGG